jgi:putative radical SAM enzyme (TIGR03279 family)
MNQGLRVKTVSSDSPAGRAGVKPGDLIFAVDGQIVEDEIDFSYYCATSTSTLEFRRGDTERSTALVRESGELVGIDFLEQKIKQCRNRCIFCFIDQLPRGLRKSLYVKDEDYRHSFLNGNYLTLCSTTDGELHKIIERGISPLYISVHATDPLVRSRMLRNRFAGKIMTQLRLLERGGIEFHAQIVVCPGYNDGKILDRTVRDLLRFRDGLRSLAIVPVGLTDHRDFKLTPVDRPVAQTVCRDMHLLSDKDAGMLGFRRLFVADEFFIKAGLPLPQRRYYEDYPQIENGVGLVRQLLDEWRGLRRAKPVPAAHGSRKKTRTIALVTGMSAAPILAPIAAWFTTTLPALQLTVVPVVNRFFGESVTVSGLLTARDLIAAVKACSEPFDGVIAPRNMFNVRGSTLDGYSVARIARVLGIPVVAAACLEELKTALTANPRRRDE